MPVRKCDDCHHEFEASRTKDQITCDWCGSNSHIIAEHTSLELFLMKDKTGVSDFERVVKTIGERRMTGG